ncbi:carbamoyl-phosphate synthase small subunit [Lactobacillus xujianguonis]|uniref:Carbamoyl phosphate synthase small chain n=1 Tax=Lactobacillus xujianguonis TaxID=2495899 RepID=A0A437SXM7_9LACO|nr:glutamine-hydrolyzing carbamoyl-phosphate synthase small subunit [Lactobacillus xujianguonis]RVU71675.1 carbamoyl-phosphate synthase small subunit [Lactobacillus xujianguonis]RVU77674.1 carbamoyl-phosphate synthase small subunit [Lactobacillus xujianguonis]
MLRYLILEDGSVYSGEAFGADTETIGEVVFTTGMTGYQEAITDQSYADQILVFTNPLIGNYGVTLADYESLEPQIKGVICHQVARRPDNWRMQTTLPDFLKQLSIPGIQGIDTRALVKKLRIHGTLRGKIANSKEEAAQIASELQQKQVTQGVISRVSTKTPYPVPGAKRNVVVIDFGIKHSILRELAKRDCNCIVLPYTATAKEVLALHPDGVLLSNGPGDPEEMVAASQMVCEVEQHLPLFGICMGHQVFALANGAKTYKMKFGHRGFNHPVREIATGQIGFTSQNHGYAVDPASINRDNLLVTHVEVNDGTIEGLRHKKYPAFSVQFHPDATPGPHDEESLFDDFMQMIDQRKSELHA